MGSLTVGRCALSVSVAAILFAGCGQSQPELGQSQAAPQAPLSRAFSATPIPPPPTGIRPQGWLSPSAKRPNTSSNPVIYVAQQFNSGVLVYPETGGPSIGDITDGVFGPYGLCVDKNGTLYVANEVGNTVTAYPAGSTTPSTTWSQDLDNPLYPIVDGSGDLFVSNQGNGNVVEYRPGSTAASQVLKTPGKETDGMDFDSQGNLYVAYRKSNLRRNGGIEEFAPGTTQGHILPMKLNEPQGLIVDASGNIIVVVTGHADRIELYKPGHRLWAQKIPAPQGATLTQIAIEANQSELFAATIEGSVSTIAYPFPPSGTLTQLEDAGFGIQGIALSNGQTF